jgi:BolA family transcriptional regulator, general stress-responsive regulator
MVVKSQIFNPKRRELLVSLGPIGKRLEAKLTASLSPSSLMVIDESNQHHGHAGAHPSGESHFRVKISATSLQGLKRVEQHRLIHAAVAEELKERVHALSIDVLPVDANGSGRS